MNTNEKLGIIAKESKEYLESISAFELMQNANLFMNDLNRLIEKHKLPASLLIGCLIAEVDMVNRELNNILLDDDLTNALRSMKRYVDRSFMKKE